MVRAARLRMVCTLCAYRAVMSEVDAPGTDSPLREASYRASSAVPGLTTVTTDRAAVLLGVSPMTIVRLIDRGVRRAEAEGQHRRISVSELARYHADTRSERRAAMAEIAGAITSATPADRQVQTR